MLELTERLRELLNGIRSNLNTVDRITESVRREPHDTKRLLDGKQNIRVHLEHLAQLIEGLDEANNGKQEQGPAL